MKGLELIDILGKDLFQLLSCKTHKKSIILIRCLPPLGSRILKISNTDYQQTKYVKMLYELIDHI